MKHRLDDPEFLNECFYYLRGFLVWKERPRNHFRTLSARDRWNKEKVGRLAVNHDYPDPTTHLCGHDFRTATLIFLLHLSKTENYKHVKFEGDYGIHIPYGVQDGQLLYTTRMSHYNGITCDNRIENLYLGPMTHRNAYVFPRDVRFEYREEQEFGRYVVYALDRGKPSQVMGYTLKEKEAKDLYYQCRRIYGR